MIFSLTSVVLWTHIWSGALPARPELWPFVLARGSQKLLYETSVSAVTCQVDKCESLFVLDHNQTIRANGAWAETPAENAPCCSVVDSSFGENYVGAFKEKHVIRYLAQLVSFSFFHR